MSMFENIGSFFKKVIKNDQKELLAESTLPTSKDAAKERLHVVLMQDRANVSADFLELMKEEIVEVIKKYIVVDETQIDVRLTNQENEDGSIGAPLLHANIPILNIRNDVKGEYIKDEKEVVVSDEETLENTTDRTQIIRLIKEESVEPEVSENIETIKDEEHIEIASEELETKNESESTINNDEEIISQNDIKKDSIVEVIEKETENPEDSIKDNVEQVVEEKENKDYNTKEEKPVVIDDISEDEEDDDVTFDDLLKKAEEEERQKELEKNDDKKDQKDEKEEISPKSSAKKSTAKKKTSTKSTSKTKKTTKK